jgi:hypothetical protein
MKQYEIMFAGESIEFTGYFKSVASIRSYIVKRYGKREELTFRAVYPQVEEKIYSI